MWAPVSDMRRLWRQQSLLLKLIIVNVAVFLAIRLTGIVALIGGWDINRVIDMLALPSSPMALMSRPWTVVTYMFTHYDVMHILFNMLALYWFGTLFLFRCTSRQLMALYIYGGLAGAAMYLAAAQIFPSVGGTLLGASAAVMAIIIGISVLMPDHEIRLFFVWDIKLKWIAVIAVASFALGLVGNNAGGHIAHCGGMLMGLWFAFRLNHGRDITKSFNHLCDMVVNLFKGSGRRPVRKKRFWKKTRRQQNSGPTSQADDRAQLDAILDKIKKSGYTSLTAEEKKRLFDVSRRVK